MIPVITNILWIFEGLSINILCLIYSFLSMFNYNHSVAHPLGYSIIIINTLRLLGHLLMVFPRSPSLQRRCCLLAKWDLRPGPAHLTGDSAPPWLGPWDSIFIVEMTAGDLDFTSYKMGWWLSSKYTFKGFFYVTCVDRSQYLHQGCSKQFSWLGQILSFLSFFRTSITILSGTEDASMPVCQSFRSSCNSFLWSVWMEFCTPC